MANTSRNPILPPPPGKDANDDKLHQWRVDLTRVLKKIHETVYSDVGNLNSLIEAVQDQLIPVGFIYVQFPGKDDPDTLFGFGTWTNVSSTFAGHFFRAEGGNASAFEAGAQAYQTALPSTDFTTGNQNASHSHSITVESHRHYNGVCELNTSSSIEVYGQYTNEVPGAADAYVQKTIGTPGYQGITDYTQPSGSAGNQDTSHGHTVTGGGDTETAPVNETIRIWERTA